MAVLTNDWRLAATLLWSDTTKKALPIAISHRFRSRIISTESSAAGVPVKWRRAGYLQQVTSINGRELSSLTVPLNIRKDFALPKVVDSYQLVFKPVEWLPRGLRLRVYEYTGPEPEQGLINELIFLR